MPDPEPYRPSNGCEGDSFMARWCALCVRKPFDPDGDGCEILNMTMACPSVWDDDYPPEWRQDGPAGPRCTAFRESIDEPGPLDPAAVIRPLL